MGLEKKRHAVSNRSNEPDVNGSPTFIALAIGADLVVLQLQQTLDRLLILGSPVGCRAPRHVLSEVCRIDPAK